MTADKLSQSQTPFLCIQILFFLQPFASILYTFVPQVKGQMPMSLLYTDFAGEDAFIVGKVLLQKSRGVQIVGTLAGALVAVQASLDLHHFRLPGRGQPGI